MTCRVIRKDRKDISGHLDIWQVWTPPDNSAHPIMPTCSRAGRHCSGHRYVQYSHPSAWLLFCSVNVNHCSPCRHPTHTRTRRHRNGSLHPVLLGAPGAKIRTELSQHTHPLSLSLFLTLYLQPDPSLKSPTVDILPKLAYPLLACAHTSYSFKPSRK